MPSSPSKQKVLREHKALLRRKEKANDAFEKETFLHRWRQRRSARKFDEKVFEGMLAQAGIDNDSLLEQKESYHKTAEAFLSRQRDVIGENVAETARRQQTLRKDKFRRHKLLSKLSGHSPLLGCVVLADDQYRRSLPRTGVPPYDIDEWPESHRRRTLDNAGDLGMRVRTGTWGSARMRHRLFNEYAWMSEEDGILEAQGYLGVNGEWELQAECCTWGNTASIQLAASLSVTQGSTTTRSDSYLMVDEFAEGGLGHGWWGEHRNGYIGSHDDIVLRPPAMEIARGDWVLFTFEIVGYVEANNGARALLNVAEGSREVNISGVAFSVS